MKGLKMKKETFTSLYKQGSKETETTTFYRDGKKHAILAITRMR